jgi:hypothetical protein
MSELGNRVHRFRGFELEPRERRLSKAGEGMTPTPQVFDTMVLVMECAEHVVCKDELKALWTEPVPSDTAGDQKSGSRLVWFFAITAVLRPSAVIWRTTPKPTSPQGGAHGRTAAVVGFANLSRNATDAWLAPALSEMLGAELTVLGDLQVVPR